MKPHIFKKAFKSTIPVLAGYIVLGAGFGMIMKANNIGTVWAVLMSVFIYAGSMQYAAVGLITSGASLLSAAVTTLMVNARHLFYGISMIDKYKDAGLRKPYLIFSLTDETYSIVCSSKEDTRFCFWVSLLNQIYWVCGTIMGSLAGTYMKINTKGNCLSGEGFAVCCNGNACCVLHEGHAGFRAKLCYPLSGFCRCCCGELHLKAQHSCEHCQRHGFLYDTGSVCVQVNL